MFTKCLNICLRYLEQLGYFKKSFQSGTYHNDLAQYAIAVPLLEKACPKSAGLVVCILTSDVCRFENKNKILK